MIKPITVLLFHTCLDLSKKKRIDIGTQASRQDFRMGGAQPSEWPPHADGPLAEKAADAVLSILGALSPRMGPLWLEMNPIRLRTEPGREVLFFFSLGLHTLRGRWRMTIGGSIVYLRGVPELFLSPGYVSGDSRAVLLFVLGRFLPPSGEKLR